MGELPTSKDWRRKYYYEAKCRIVACILYAKKSCAVANHWRKFSNKTKVVRTKINLEINK